MSEEQPTRDSTGKRERWTDNTRIIWGLFALVGLLVGAGMTTLWTDIRDHESRLRVVERDGGVIGERLKAIDEIKIDIKEIKARFK